MVRIQLYSKNSVIMGLRSTAYPSRDINPRPDGVCRATRPDWGHFDPPPLRYREPRNVATSSKQCWIALGVKSLKHIKFLKVEVTGQVKLRSNAKYYAF